MSSTLPPVISVQGSVSRKRSLPTNLWDLQVLTPPCRRGPCFASLSSMQILVADESRAVRAITRSALQQTRFGADAVRDAEAGDQVLSWIHTRPAGTSFVIADWNLPGMNGFALMDRLEELRIVDEVGVLFCVNELQVPLAQAAVQRGAAGYIVRPFSDEDLRA